MSDVQKTVLANGVRVLTERIDAVGSAAIGVWCRTGSRHELPGEEGITHFIEHMLFKGTARRTSHQIAEEIEGRGGHLNAFTDKEQTCYYCRVLAEDSANGLDVLTDMLTNAALDAEELEREKGVVLEEIKRGEDEPGDLVHELHLQGLWPGHRLGDPIIGTRETVSGFSRDDLVTYMGRRYRAENVLVSVAGKIDHQAVVDQVQSVLGSVPNGLEESEASRPSPTGGDQYIGKEVEQVHFCIGGQGVSYYDDDFYTAVVLDGVLGGGMSSRLFQEVREKRGLAYAIGSYMLTYTHGGAFTIYGGTGRETWPELQKVVRTELDRLIQDGPTQAETEKVQRQIAGNLVLGLEGMNARMHRMAKNEFIHGRQIPMEETVEKIRAVTPAQMQAFAARALAPEAMRTTAIGPAQRA